MLLLGMLAVLAVAMARFRNLFTVVMLSSIYSLLAASLFVSLDAVDVAFTEAAVGAGISTVLLLGALAVTGHREHSQTRSRSRLALPFVVVSVTGAALIYGTLGMPRFGDPRAPVHTHVAPRYLKDSAKEVGPPNVVTSVLASYRGFDTLGEVVVIFTAGVGVMMLLGGRARRDGEGEP